MQLYFMHYESFSNGHIRNSSFSVSLIRRVIQHIGIESWTVLDSGLKFKWFQTAFNNVFKRSFTFAVFIALDRMLIELEFLSLIT